ncbi:MAG: ABC transporter substrate-binding protein [bacterium]
MKNIAKKISPLHLLTGWCFAALTFLTACTVDMDVATDTVDLLENNLVYARGGDAVTLDPGSMEDGFSAQVANQVFEGLVQFKPDSIEVSPCLATSWETSEDQKIWTFHLRENVTFHDGTPFTADAVVLSMMRMIDENHPHHLPGQMPYAEFVYKGIVEKVEKVDDHSVRIHLTKPYAPLLQNLAMFCCFIVSPAAMEKYGDSFGEHPVGTGPFKFDYWQRDVEIHLVKNEHYWGEPAKLDSITFKVVREPDVRLISMIRGEAHLMDGVEPQLVLQAQQHEHLVVEKSPGLNVSYAYMNVKAEPFTNTLVRQAVNYAVNKQAICEHLFDNLAVPCRGIFPPGILGHDPESSAYQYDPDKARELLRQAGYENGLEFELLTYSVPRPYNPMGARLAEVVQGDLAKVGIRARITQVEWGTLLDRTLSHHYQMAMLGWITDNGDPDNFAYALLAYEGNRSQFDHSRFVELALQGQRTYDPEERLKIYREAQAIAIDEAPWLFLNHFSDLAIRHRRVQGYRLHPSGQPQLWHVSLSNANE